MLFFENEEQKMSQITDIPLRIVNVSAVSSDATITVYEAGTSTTVLLFSDEVFTMPVANPFIVPTGNPIPELYTSFPGKIRVEVADGSGLLFDDDPYDRPVGEADLASPIGAAMVGTVDGGNVQDAVNVAANTAALIASTKPLPVGATIRTADGFIYEVASDSAGDNHLVTAGGAKLYVLPQGPGARQWGVEPDAGVDVWQYLQNALDNQPIVQLEDGEYLVTRGLRQTQNGSTLCGAGIGKTFVRAISPTGDGEFGGTDGSEAVVWAAAPEGAPLFGLKCEDVTLDCAGLMTGLPVGDVRLKGQHYRRVHNFEVNRVEVIDCGSYAFWANDKIIEDGGTITGCIGVYNDCVAKDAEIFFETTGRCYVTYNRPRAEQTRDTWDWPVQETFHFYGGDGLITVNDGYAKVASSTVIGPLLTQKNVVWNGGYYEQLNLTTVINMGTPTGNYDNWAFNDVTMVGAGAVGALSFGGLSGPDNKMTIKGGKFVALNGAGPTFTAINAGWGSVDMLGADCTSTTVGTQVPRSLIVAGTFKSFNVFGGNQEVYGSAVGTSPVNAPSARFTSTQFLPSSSPTIASIRQSHRGSAAFANSGGYARINFAIPLNVENKAKLVVTGAVEASATSAAGAAEAVPFSWNNPSANIINILADSAAVGRTFNFLVVEYQ